MIRNLSENRQIKFLFLGIIMTLMLAVSNLYVSNILATTGESLKVLQQRKNNLQEQNSQIREQIIKFSSLETVNLRAQELGLLRSNKVLSLSLQPPMALNQP